jgi:hypothetical protein
MSYRIARAKLARLIGEAATGQIITSGLIARVLDPGKE